MVPNGWSLNYVGDLFTVQLGKMLNKAAKAQFPQFQYFGNSDVKWGDFDFSQLKSMHFNERERQKFTLQKGDILMCEGGEVGRCSIWTREQDNIYYQKALHRLRSNGAIIPEYFYNFMSFIAGTKALNDYTTRTSIAHLTREKLLKIPVKTPPLPEQHKIAKILSTWDKAISTTERLIDNSKQQKKALMQQLLTGTHSQRKRLLDDSGKPFEGEWTKVELGKLLDYKQPTPYLVKSTDYSNEYSIPVLTAGKTFILGYSNENFGIFEEELPAIIFDDFTTASKFVDFPFKAKSSAMKILVAKQGVSIKFIYEAMQVLNYPVGGHQRHWISIFANLVIGLPSLLEQQKIASVLSNADKEIELLEQQLADLKKEKKALMQQLLTGKRRVKI